MTGPAHDARARPSPWTDDRSCALRRRRWPGSAAMSTTLASCLSARDLPVLVVTLPGMVAHVMRLPVRRVRRILWQVPLAISIAVCGVIFVLGARPAAANLDAPALVVTTGLMFAWSRRTWREFQSLAPALEAIIGSARERRAMTRRMQKCMRWTPQILLSGAGALAGAALGVLTLRKTGSGTFADGFYVLIDAVAVGIGANIMYWLWCAVAWLSAFSQLTSIRLADDPERDPAIRGCQRMVHRVRLRVIGGLLCAEIPLVALWLVDADVVPVVASVCVLLLCAVTGMAVGVLPVMYLGSVRKTDQDRKADAVLRWRDEVVASGEMSFGEAEKIYRQTLHAIRRRPTHPLNAEAVGLILATVIAPMLPVLITLLLPRSGG